jgi:diguanylate cyclase (GGDEF)-like protein
MLEQRIAEGQRLNKESLAVMSMDVDDFKKVNDSYGHAVGDRVLASIARVIKKEMRQMDILTRYAGDEFVAIMPMASTAMANLVAERVRSAVQSQRYSVRTGKTIEIGISIGVACFPVDGETTEQLFSTAARNMQHDKHARKLVPDLTETASITQIDNFR